MTESGKSQKKKLFEVFAAILLLIFAAGIIELFLLRFEVGDVYPYYSSLRSDPLGAKALYESLQECCGLLVWRNYEPFTKIKEKQNAAIFFLGQEVPTEDLLPKHFFQELESFVKNGGRLVVTYLPKKAAAFRKDRPKSELKEGREKPNDWVKYTQRWGYSYAVMDRLDSKATASRDSRFDQSGLPKSISSHTALYFKNPDVNWRVVYRQEGFPVIMEKQIGKGTLVLSTLTYFVSNEAMLRERHPGLILWLIGAKQEIIFDEYFHGTGKRPGVAALMREYDLEFTLILLILLAALYIWKNALPLVPIPESERKADVSSSLGKDSSAGLTNLLRRNIPAREILRVCYQEWKKSISTRKVVSSEKLSRLETILIEGKRSKFDSRKVVHAYNQVSEVLKEK